MLFSSEKKRKRVQEEEESSSGSGRGRGRGSSGSGSSCTQKSKMDPRRTSEQQLLTESLRRIALPMISNKTDSWLSIRLWNEVTNEYNRRAAEYEVPQRMMPNLVHLARKLEYCHCRKGEEQVNT